MPKTTQQKQAYHSAKMMIVIDDDFKEEYMTNLWKRIMDESSPDIIVECALLNFESKIQIGWPDPRKYW
jgi:hypothetical protein